GAHYLVNGTEIGSSGALASGGSGDLNITLSAASTGDFDVALTQVQVAGNQAGASSPAGPTTPGGGTAARQRTSPAAARGRACGGGKEGGRLAGGAGCGASWRPRWNGSGQRPARAEST